MMVQNHPYANALYHILIGNIIQFGQQIDCNQEHLSFFFEQAILEKDSLKRIHCLENLFWTIDEHYRFDYDDFCFYLR